MSTTQILDVKILIYCVLIREFPLGLLLFVDTLIITPRASRILCHFRRHAFRPCHHRGSEICWACNAPPEHRCLHSSLVVVNCLLGKEVPFLASLLLFVVSALCHSLVFFIFFHLFSLFFLDPLCFLIGFNPDRYFTVKDHYAPLSFQLASYIYHIVIDL